MQVFGDVKSLKGALEQKYGDRVREIEANANAEAGAIESEAGEKIGLMKADAGAELTAKENTAKARALNEEKMKAKREFENEREKLIAMVFDEIAKRKNKIAESREYIAHVKSTIPKKEKLEAVGGSAKYRGKFKNLKIDKKITGLVFRSGNTAYDFTIDKIVEGDQEKLRGIAIEKLFGA